MPYTDTNTQLVLNVLTQQQYDEITTKEENQVYLITDESGNTGDYLPLTGGILTGPTGISGFRYNIVFRPDTNSQTFTRVEIGDSASENVFLGVGSTIGDTNDVAAIRLGDTNGVKKIGLSVDTTGNGSMTMSGVDSSSTTTGTMVITGGVGVSGNIYAANVYGAVWNDFAEFREGPANIPGYVFSEVGDDTIELSRRRLQPGSMICSDTYGFAIGETDKAITPIAVAGRVLAYPMEDREEYRYHIGGFVGASENGRVTIMTPDEVRNYPESIIGTISAVPDYEEWGAEGHKVRVDGRVWIKVR